MVEDDQVEMMDVVVNLVVHLVVNAFHHLVYHHLVLVVNGMVYETDHHQEVSRDAAYAVHQAWEHLEDVVMEVDCQTVQEDCHRLDCYSAEVEDPVEGQR